MRLAVLGHPSASFYDLLSPAQGMPMNAGTVALVLNPEFAWELLCDLRRVTWPLETCFSICNSQESTTLECLCI